MYISPSHCGLYKLLRSKTFFQLFLNFPTDKSHFRRVHMCFAQTELWKALFRFLTLSAIYYSFMFQSASGTVSSHKKLPHNQNTDLGSQKFIAFPDKGVYETSWEKLACSIMSVRYICPSSHFLAFRVAAAYSCTAQSSQKHDIDEAGDHTMSSL